MNKVAVKYPKAKSRDIKNISTVNELLENIFLNCSEDVLHTYNLIHDYNDSESLHQLRISLRKFKSFLYFFKNEINNNERKNANNLIKELLAPTSKMRDFDVVRENYLSPAFYKHPNNSEFDLLQNYTGKVQTQLHESTLEKLLSNQYLNLLNKLIKWAANRKWGVQLKLSQLNTLEKKPNKLIKNKIRKHHKKIIKEKENVLNLTQKELHRLRASTKVLRYIISDLGIFIKHSKSELEYLKRVQDLLGKINDTYIAIHVIEKLSQNIDIENTRTYIQDKADNLRSKYLLELTNIS